MNMLKKIAAAVLAGVLVMSLSVPAFAYGWRKNGNSWMYEGTNGNYVKKKWLQIEGEWYHFDKNGNMDANKWIDNKYYVGMDGAMLVNTVTPDGYQVGPDGAKVRNEANNYGAPVTAPPASSSGTVGPGTVVSGAKANPNLQSDPLQGVLSPGGYLEFKGTNDHNVIFTRSSQGMLFLTIAHGGAGISGTEVDEAIVLRRDGDGYVFGKLTGTVGEFTVYFGGSSITITNGQGKSAHYNGTYYRK